MGSEGENEEGREGGGGREERGLTFVGRFDEGGGGGG